MKKYISFFLLCLLLKSVYGQEYVIFNEDTSIPFESIRFTINKGEVLVKKGESILFFKKAIPISQLSGQMSISHKLPTDSSYIKIQGIIQNNPLSIHIEDDNSLLLIINANNLKTALQQQFQDKKLNIKFYTPNKLNEKNSFGAELVNDTVLRQPFKNYAYRYVRYAITLDSVTYPDIFIDPSTFSALIPEQNSEGDTYFSLAPYTRHDETPAQFNSPISNSPQKQSEKSENSLYSKIKSPIDYFMSYILVLLEIIIIILLFWKFRPVGKKQEITSSTNKKSKEISENKKSKTSSPNIPNNSERHRNEDMDTQSQVSSLPIDANAQFSSFTEFKDILEKMQTLFSSKALDTLPSKEDIGKLASASQMEKIQEGLTTISSTLAEKDKQTTEQFEKNARLSKEVEQLSAIKETLQNELFQEKEKINSLNKTIEETRQKLNDIPEGILYIGNCQRFIRPYLDLLSYMAECEEKITDIIQNAPSGDVNKLKLLLAKYAEAKPDSALIEWNGILKNLQINGMVVHPIKNDIEKEPALENRIKILKQKIFEQLFRPYLSSLLILIEEMRTANEYMELNQRISINLKDCINKILSDTRMLDYNVVYFPMLQQIQGNDYSKIESRENPEIIRQYPAFSEFPPETILAIEKYAVNLDNSVQEKTVIITK